MGVAVAAYGGRAVTGSLGYEPMRLLLARGIGAVRAARARPGLSGGRLVGVLHPGARATTTDGRRNSGKASQKRA